MSRIRPQSARRELHRTSPKDLRTRQVCKEEHVCNRHHKADDCTNQKRVRPHDARHEFRGAYTKDFLTQTGVKRIWCEMTSKGYKLYEKKVKHYTVGGMSNFDSP